MCSCVNKGLSWVYLPTTLKFAERDPLSLETVQAYSPSRLPCTVSRLLYVVEVAFRSTWLMEYSGLLLSSVPPLRVHVTLVGGVWVVVQLRTKEGGWKERTVSRWNPTGVSRTGPPEGRNQFCYAVHNLAVVRWSLVQLLTWVHIGAGLVYPNIEDLLHSAPIWYATSVHTLCSWGESSPTSEQPHVPDPLEWRKHWTLLINYLLSIWIEPVSNAVFIQGTDTE